MDVRVFSTPGFAADFVGDTVVAQMTSRRNLVLGLATGGTMEPIYQRITETIKFSDGTKPSLITYNLDEYFGLPKRHQQRYDQFMETNLFRFLRSAGVDLEAHFPSLENADTYDRMIERSGGIDVQLLGIGGNSHIAFNEPGTPLESKTRVVELSQETRLANARFFASIDDVPSQAVSVGLSTICGARRVIIVATGEHKAQAIASSLCAEDFDAHFPASVLVTRPNNCTWVLDRDAASQVVRYGCFESNAGENVGVALDGKDRLVCCCLPHEDPLVIVQKMQETLQGIGVLKVSVRVLSLGDVGQEIADIVSEIMTGDDSRASQICIEYPECFSEKKVRVLKALRGVQGGHSVTYGQLASMAGLGGAARFVGSVMSSNPYAPVIGCHRVTSAGNAKHKYSGFGGPKTKISLLEKEKKRKRGPN